MPPTSSGLRVGGDWTREFSVDDGVIDIRECGEGAMEHEDTADSDVEGGTCCELWVEDQEEEVLKTSGRRDVYDRSALTAARVWPMLDEDGLATRRVRLAIPCLTSASTQEVRCVLEHFVLDP